MDFPGNPKIAPRVDSAQIAGTSIDQNQLPNKQVKILPPQGKWLFDGKKIFFNGMDVGEMLKRPTATKSISDWVQLANQIGAFKFHFIAKRRKRKRFKKLFFKMSQDEDDDPEICKLAALADAYIEKITRMIRRRYDETSDGVSLTLDEDSQLILNGMNVSAFIDMACKNPSDKAKIFLKGLKNRLRIITANNRGPSSYEGLQVKVAEIINTIDREVERIIEEERLLKKPGDG